jgi:hypothetical protein
MPAGDREQDDRLDLVAPERLVRDLRAAYRVEVAVPAEVDDRILIGARRRAGRAGRRRVALGALAAAACLLVALALLRPVPDAPTAAPVTLAREDLDRDGEVTILDAFMLARGLASSADPPAEWDVDGDGVAGDGDVRLVAMAAVSLDREVLQ